MGGPLLVPGRTPARSASAGADRRATTTRMISDQHQPSWRFPVPERSPGSHTSRPLGASPHFSCTVHMSYASFTRVHTRLVWFLRVSVSLLPDAHHDQCT